MRRTPPSQLSCLSVSRESQLTGSLSATDETQRTAPPVSPASQIAELVRERKFCAAARLYSERTGANLIDSKLEIDRLALRHGLAPISGCASYFVLMLLAGAAGATALLVTLVRLT